MRNWFKKNAPLLIVLLVAGSLRFINLGYSDFQGDEIKALFTPEPGQKISTFLMDQRKGPIQFLVTALVKVVDPTYTNYFIDRLPFAIAGFLAVLFFYKFVELAFGKKLAFYSSLFLATNGFFVAFSRLIQYQSFVIFFMILALYFFALAGKTEKWKVKGLYLGFIFWALSILSHYDGIFITPFALYLLWPRIKDKHLWLSLIVPALMLAAFYIPFVFSISDATMLYWQGRLEGIGGKISSSRYLFQVYQPIYIVHLYTLLGFLGFAKLAWEFVQSFFKKLYNDEAHAHIFKHIFLLLWIALPVIFFELLVTIPGTHIFVYLIPLILIVSIGITFVEDVVILIAKKLVLLKFSKTLIYVGLTAMFSFIAVQSYAVFVDHNGEYPWSNKKFLIWTLPRPITTYHLSLFGFPYNRNWLGIRNLVMSSENNGYYSTNERVTIARYYIPLIKEGNYIGYYIYIQDPQSFITGIDNDPVIEWMKTHGPVFVYSDSTGKEVSKVYYLYQGNNSVTEN